MKTRLFSCTHPGCHQSYRDDESLQDHFQSHTKSDLHTIKKYICKKCDREFGTKQGVKEHMYTHSVKKIFKCHELGCGKAFRQSSQLCNHKKIHSVVKEMIGRQSKEDQKTADVLKDLSSQFVTMEFPDIYTEVLPPIKGPVSGVMLPRFDSI